MSHDPVAVTFLVTGAKHPIGGAIALYEFANGLSRLGHDVQVLHIDFIGNSQDQVYRIPDPVESLDDIEWFRFEPGIRHHFPRSFEESALPQADFIFYGDDRVPTRSGLPAIVLQGYQMLPEEFEHRLYRARCPKICIAAWLVDVGRELGVADDQLVHIPYGLQHDKYRMVTPIEARPLQVSMLYNSHPTKAANLGLGALAELRRRIPELRVVVFGGMGPIHPIPEGITYLTSPDQDVIVTDIYNQSRVFINSSLREGFGLACVEAMACGCALVTTSNGGSDDYAFHAENALVSEPGDVGAMVDHVEALLVDDALRTRLAMAGNAYVQRFDWDDSARMLEDFLHGYRDDPSRYQEPPLGAMP